MRTTAQLYYTHLEVEKVDGEDDRLNHAVITWDIEFVPSQRALLTIKKRNLKFEWFAGLLSGPIEYRARIELWGFCEDCDPNEIMDDVDACFGGEVEVRERQHFYDEDDM